MKHWIIASALALGFFVQVSAQHSVARIWNEILLEGIRGDFARPTVHARNLYHSSAAMYDAWAVFDSVATPLFLGNHVEGFEFPFDGFPTPSNVEEARREAISYAMYRLLRHRFLTSPGAWELFTSTDELMLELGYNPNQTSIDYNSGSAAALGNYIASLIIQFGLQDGANEALGYENLYYSTVNPPLVMNVSGNSSIIDPNRWQSLTLNVFIDQSGNVIPLNTPEFLSPEWGNVSPFALQESENFDKADGNYRVFENPGEPWYIQDGLGMDDPYKWGFALVSVWSSHLGVTQDTLIDISPASIGNNDILPTTFEEYKLFYKLKEGGDVSPGHLVNPETGQPYEPNLVRRSDYGRVLAEYWADGPDSETPPGHWFTLLNYVNDRPELEKRFEGKGPELSTLEWDVKSYLALGGTMHDCAVAAWGVKGYYDYIRPVSAIRYMATKGQSSFPDSSSYHPHGLPLIEGYIEIVQPGDALAGSQGENIGEIKILAWKGPDFIADPENSLADVGWILGKEWWPYQRPSFVTPPFAGYVSGHSTFSRAAADMLEQLTGNAFFPGGIAEFQAKKNEFLVFEDGPSEDVILQWATYRDASDQTSLSRIWGGIHPPVDDIPGRKMGTSIAKACFEKVKGYFYKDEDADGFYSYEDCDDFSPLSFPGAVEVCDGMDNNCDGLIDEDLELFVYYLDEDGDGYGDPLRFIDTCLADAPQGFVDSADDCEDMNGAIYPEGVEICDGMDNDCDGLIDEDLPLFTYYFDSDLDGFGDANVFVVTCSVIAPSGYVVMGDDCDDLDANIYPGAEDIPDNDVDEDCSGRDASTLSFIWQNSGEKQVLLHYPSPIEAELRIYDLSGRVVEYFTIDFDQNYVLQDVSKVETGIYVAVLFDRENKKLLTQKLFFQI